MSTRPLADEIRPQSLDEVVGQRHLIGPGGVLRRLIDAGTSANMIFYGPSGTGKTTIANIIANKTNKTLYRLNATTASLQDVKDIIASVGTLMAPGGILLYLDEIQYFNKKQQQSLLEFMENGSITLIASTTENPFFYVYNALLSRSTVFEFKQVEPRELLPAVERALGILKERSPLPLAWEEGVPMLLATQCGGDVRKAINACELLYEAAETKNGELLLTSEDALQVAQRSAMRYDKGGDAMYDMASALMKSLRGSDPDAALHYLARFLEAGDLVTPCRRLLCSASEDIGMAYPQAVAIVKACVDTAMQLGLPEAQLPLAQAAILLATAPKSNSVGRRQARQDRRYSARAAKRSRGLHGPRARAGLQVPARVPEPLGEAAIPARPDQKRGLLSLRRQQGRAGRGEILGGDQECRWTLGSVTGSK